MLRSLTEIEGAALIATDGEIGHCRDFLFDDDDWTLRYMVAETGPWLLSRKVLVSLTFIEPPAAASQGIPVRLARQQIEDCPPLDSDAPVSRRYEQTYHDFFATPYYWMGTGLWGNFGYPGLMVPTPDLDSLPDEDPERTHLRSVREVTGYGIRARDGLVGHVADFIVDDRSWAIRHLVLERSRLPFSKKTLIAIDAFDAVSWVEREIRLDATAEEIEGAPPFDPDALPADEQEAT
ncbi:PRC-barrel domain-containing protein [Thiocystis violacea]|uniref:PRC-barrel domain containing protein n=1 Tax=Thiocystis violacea TaxID=13725 RepID=UPI00190825D8|nr:PRC-barrel domain-containing protein [Thiocystis violacea]